MTSYNVYYSKVIMKKLMLFLLLLLAPIFVEGQVKNQYGYPLMKLEAFAEKLPAGHYLHQTERLAKTAVSSVDYSDKVTVRDQLTGNTCVSFVSTSALELVRNLQQGSKVESLFAPSFAYNFTNLNNHGSSFFDALPLFQEEGCAKEKDFPYTPKDWKRLPNFQVLESALPYKIDSWSWWYIGDTLPRSTPGSYPIAVAGYLGINNAKKLLAEGRQVMMEFSATDAFNSDMIKEDWIYSYAAYGNSQPVGGHALLAVGYDDNKQTKDGPGAMRFLNSWGDKMDHGFVWISYKALALQQFPYRFYTIKLRENYQPKLFVEVELSGLDSRQYWYQNCGLKVNGQITTQGFFTFQPVLNYTYPSQMVFDLTDIAGNITSSATFFVKMDKITGNSVNPMIKSLHFIDRSRNIDYYVVTNTVVNGEHFYAEWSFRSTDFNLSVLPANSVTVKEKDQLSVKVNVNPNKPLQYSLSSTPAIPNLSIDTAGQIIWTPDYNQAGVYKIVIKGMDTDGASSSIEVMATVLHTNRAPVMSVKMSDQTVPVHNVGQPTFTFSYAATDADNDQLIFSLKTGPAHSSITQSGKFTWTPTPDQANQSFPVTVYVSDGSLLDSAKCILTGSFLVGVEDIAEIPKEYTLSQNYPNPFNPTTTIRFALPKSGHVTLAVYNLLGQEVALLSNEDLTAGAYNTKFDAGKLASGIYMYVLHTADYTASRKMILMK